MTDPDDSPAQPDAGDGDVTAHLLRLAGAREGTDPERMSRVRQAVLAECRVVAERRRTFRRAVTILTGLSLAAAAALAVRLWTGTGPPAPAPGEVIATVVRIEGASRLVSAAQGAGSARSLAASAPVHAGEGVETTGNGRLGLRLARGASVRFDVASRARLLSATVMELTEGTVYVDNPQEGNGIEVRTSMGTVRDVGTQFEVRLRPSSLRVRVRSGLVALRRTGQETTGRTGTELLVEADRVVSRGVAVHGPQWAWTSSLAPTIPIEGRALRAVLEELCREHGWTLRYAGAALAREASEATLHGSIEGLSGEDALAAVFAASGFGHRLENGELLVMHAVSRPLR